MMKKGFAAIVSARFPGLVCPAGRVSIQSPPMRILRASVVIFVLLIAQALCLAAPETAEFRNGHWQTTKAPPTTTAAPDPALIEIERLLKIAQPSEARVQVLKWLKAHPVSPLRDRGVFLLAQAYFDLDERILAFYHFDEVMDLWVDSRLFGAALQKQYDIADAFLSGHKQKFLGMPILDASGDAIEMMFRIQQRAPGSTLAEKALLRTADFYYSEAQFDVASDTYAAYARAYPRSPYIPRVRLRQAFSSLAQFRGTMFDATPMIDARAQMVDLISAYPDLAREENLPEWIDNIDRTFAKKLYETAAFYRRTHEPAAAAYILHYLINNYPQSSQGQQARVDLARLEARR